MTSSRLSLYVLKSEIVVASFMGDNCSAQNWQTDTIDSLIAKGNLQSTVQAFYIRPIIEQYQSIVSVEGTGFSAPQNDLLRKRGFGIRLGYQWGQHELETGISVIRPAAGYSYMVNGSYGQSTQVRSTDYHQFPLIYRYLIWQLTKHISLHVGAGLAYNVNIDKSILDLEDHPEEGIIDADGNRIILARFSRRYDQAKSFVSGEINITSRWSFLSNLSANLEIKRLISSNNIVNLIATQETFNPSNYKNVEAHGGANSYSINLEIVYQFRFNKHYKLKQEYR